MEVAFFLLTIFLSFIAFVILAIRRKSSRWHWIGLAATAQTVMFLPAWLILVIRAFSPGRIGDWKMLGWYGLLIMGSELGIIFLLGRAVFGKSQDQTSTLHGGVISAASILLLMALSFLLYGFFAAQSGL